MTAADLRSLQERIKFDGPSLATCLGIPYEQFRRYKSGHTAIPEAVERRLKEIEQINITFMAELPQRVDRQLQKEFKGGVFLSEPCE